MPSISRRQVLQTLGTASVAVAASLAMPANGKQAKKRLAVPDPKSLYLIFPGAWAFFYENGRLFAVTPDFQEHTYDLGLSLPSGQPRMPIEKGQTYTVDVAGYSAATSFPDLINPMVIAKQGMIFKSIQRKAKPPVGLRIVSLPLPSSISPAALIHGAIVNIDPTQTEIPNPQQWPAALALVYSGPWRSASIKSSDSTQPIVSVISGSLPVSHYTFRTCVTAQCNLPLECTIDCAKANNDIAHVKHVHGQMMDMFDFNGKMIPTIDFPPCTVGTDWPVTIDRGNDTNIHESEIGMERHCKKLANLHNCASGTMIVRL